MAQSREAAPAWTISYGAELWRRTPVAIDKRSASGVAVSSGMDIGDVIDRVSHAIERPDATALPRTKAQTFTATFDGEGLRFSPHRPNVLAGAPVADPSTEARIRTARVAIGARELYRDDDRAVSWSLLGNTAQGLLDGAAGLIEHVEVRGEGVEIAWVLRERPSIAGELVVDLAVDGLAFGAQTAGGVHFVDATGVARMRIGEAVLVDAQGARWPIATELVEGQPRWRVDAGTLAGASFPVALDPIVGPELGVDEPIVSAAPSTEAQPAVASSASGYLVVWQSNPNGTWDIAGARVSSVGVVLDPGGLAISTAANHQSVPSVASNGTDYLVVWYDERSGSNPDIYGARVTSDGAVTDAVGIPISTAANGQYSPTVASNGTDYMVAWRDDRNTPYSHIYGARVTSAGVVADSVGIAISTAPESQSSPSVASNGTDYLVAWSSNTNVYGARVTSAGVVSDPNRIAIATATNAQILPSVASNSTDYLVVWQDTRNSATYDIYGARVTSAGTVADPTGIAISTAANAQESVSVASNGTGYLVAWADYRSGSSFDLYGARVTSAGTVTDSTGIAISTAASIEYAPSVASIGTAYVVAWQDDLNGSVDIRGARVSSTGEVQEPNGFVVSTITNQQTEPAVAASSSGFLVAWRDDRNVDVSGLDIYGTRISAGGVIEDVTGIAISTAANSEDWPAVASNGTDYLVTWSDTRTSTPHIYGARVTSAGTVADTAGIGISGAAGDHRLPTVASNGTDYLVAWMQRNGFSYDIYGARVTSAGVVADTPSIPIATAAQSEDYPSMASNGTDYLIAWHDYRNGANADIYGSRITAAGAVADAAGIAISTAAGNQYRPSVAFNGTDYLVAWQDNRSGSSYDIYGARVTSAGAVADTAGIAISTAANDQEYASVAFNGTDYVIAWQDLRSGSSYDVYGARITSAGAVADANGFPISTAIDAETHPRVAATSGLSPLVVYEARRRATARLITTCGDSQIEASEACDDGGTSSGDGCSVICTVEPGYTCSGVPSNCADIDECATNNGGCDLLTTCTNTPGSRTCGACPAGYTGTGETGCADIDECTTNNGGCDLLTTCTNMPGSRTCSACPAGYTGTGETGCADINECTTNNGGCDLLTTCANTQGSRTCSACPAGYTGTGETGCADIDECTTNNGGCSTDPLVTCMNIPGGSTCGACPTGYSGDGISCSDIDECALGTAACAQNATCTNTNGGATCVCPPGYSGDGTTCTADSDSEPESDGGCGCRTSASGQTSIFALAFALALALRRRRRRAPRREIKPWSARPRRARHGYRRPRDRATR